MYGVAQSRIVHTNSKCCGQSLHALSPEEARDRRLCRKCVLVCLICGEKCASRVTCHAVCEGCVVEYLHHLAQDHTWDGATVPCPCGSGVHMDPLPAAAQNVVATYRHRIESPHKAFRRCAIEEMIDQIVTAHCPACGAAFFDFDGCCAVQCRCRAHFCALCLQQEPSSRKCHDHVQVCRYNPTCDIFLTQRQYQHARRRAQSWSIVRKLVELRRTESLLYALSAARAIKKLGVPLAPTLIQAVFFWLCAIFFACILPYTTLMIITVGCLTL